MLCEVIAYILSRQRLSAKTFVTGCVFYALQDRLSLWMLCDTAGVGKLSASPSHGFALWASPAVTHGVSPPGTVGAGWEVSLFSPSPLLHGFSLRASPAVTHSASPAGDSGCGSHHKKSGISDKKRPKMGLFCSYMTKVCIVSVANLSQLCTLLLHYLSCIFAA